MIPVTVRASAPLAAPIVDSIKRSAAAVTKGAASLSPDKLVQRFRESRQVKARLEPAFTLMAQAGFAAEATRVRRAHFVLTGGKSGKVDYDAAAMPMNLVFFNRDTFKELSTPEIASVLVHEGTHLEQSMLLKAYGGIGAEKGLKPENDISERQAYHKQAIANRRLGVTHGEIYSATAEVLHAMGEDPNGNPLPPKAGTSPHK